MLQFSVCHCCCCISTECIACCDSLWSFISFNCTHHFASYVTELLERPYERKYFFLSWATAMLQSTIIIFESKEEQKTYICQSQACVMYTIEAPRPKEMPCQGELWQFIWILVQYECTRAIA